MELKQLNRIIALLAMIIGMNVFSQIKMTNIEGKKISINSKTEKRNIIKIFDDNNYSLFYIVDRRDFNLKKGLGVNGRANIIFFSKKYNKGLLANFEQMIYHTKKNIYNITLYVDKYVIPSMIIVDENFNYEYVMTNYFGPLPENDVNVSRIGIQDYKNYCKLKKMSLNKIIIEEKIDDILKILDTKTITSTNCEPTFNTADLKYFFPEKIIK